jgi:peptide/nickel transport system substrate-binding protein
VVSKLYNDLAKMTIQTGVLFCACFCISLSAAQSSQKEEFHKTAGEIGRRGGTLVVALRAEPKTLNPITAIDEPSREVIGVTQADLVHINRATQLTEPALAKSWNISSNGLRYVLKLREGVRFSDGQPLTADDVVFSFHVYLDENVHSPQRDLLIVGGKPIEVRKLDTYTVEFRLAKPYGAAERLFDGFAILPRHLLEKPYREGKLSQYWPLATSPAEWAGLGPFRLKEYVPGQKLVLERNPYYWKTDANGTRLPYLDELVFLFVPSADSQVLDFQAGQTDIITGLSADNFSVLSRNARGFTMTDAGPSQEFNFLFFNLNNPPNGASPDTARKHSWFTNVKFRQAVSSAIDRQAIVRLVYEGRGVPLWGPVTPGDHRWQDSTLQHPARSLDRARELLREAGFSFKKDANGAPILLDRGGSPVKFSVISSSSNTDRLKMATLIQDDLSHLGMQVQVVPLEFRSLLDRVLQTKDYDACILGLASYDTDPNSDINVWLSSGGTHLWDPSQAHPATPWEAEIDRLMEQQLTALNFSARKKMYDRVQEILEEYQPMIFLASPDVLVGARNNLGNFHPAELEPNGLWNVEQIYFRPGGASSR